MEKLIKKLKAKKAKVGTMIPNISTPQSNLTPIRIDQEYMDDSAAKLMGGKSTKELKDDELYRAKLEANQQTANPQEVVDLVYAWSTWWYAWWFR